MNVYGSQLWYLEFIWNLFGIYLEFIWNLFGIYLEFIWNLFGIYLEFIWNLFNSSNELHKTIIRGLFYNKGSSIAENIRYFMYKYIISVVSDKTEHG